MPPFSNESSSFFSKENAAKILVVDDDIPTRVTSAKILQKEGYSVEQADNGLSAIEKFKTFKPDLVLLDVVMPEMDGFEACKTLRLLCHNENLPILMLTGLDDVEAIDQAFSAGATDFITKPINWPLLIRRVRYALRSYAITLELHRTQLRQNHAQKIARIGFWEWQPHTDQLIVSSNLQKLFSLPANSAESKLSDYLGFIDESERSRVVETLNLLTSGDQKSISLEHQIKSDNWSFMVRMIAAHDGNGTVYGAMQDITDLYETERKLEYQRYHDSLTHLANRRLFTQKLEDALISEQPLTVISLDINRFSLINDTLGHKEGDKLLQLCASRANRSLHGEGTVARMGGDEFCVLLEDQIDSASVIRLINDLQDALNQPCQLGDQQIQVETCAGISQAPKDGRTAEEILNAAIKARQTAKQLGGSRYVFFDAEQQQDNSRRLYLESELRQALKKNQFKLFYQPQIDVANHKIVGVEALIRWIHPEMGLVPPIQFIPIVEELELIHPLGDWIAEEAVRQAKDWFDRGLPVRVGINLSALQFTRSDFAGTLHDILQTLDLPPQYLDLEITESVAMQNPQTALKMLNQLKQTGASLAIDDFGTGYSSLEYLQKFPVDYIKIDRAFIKNIVHNPADQAIVKAIIGIAESMDMRVIAEGIEEENEYQLLKEAGCHEVQGYFISKPVEAGEAERFIREFNQQ